MKNKLHDACERNDINDVIELIKEGVDLNLQNEDQMSALLYCCSKGKIEIAALLIKAGADLEAKGISGSTPLTLATACGHGFVVQLLLDNGADIDEPMKGMGSALTLASMRGFTDIASFLIRRGADIDFKGGQNGKTPLMIAVEIGCKELVEIFVEQGADVNIVNDNGHTALGMVAASDFEMMQLLMSGGATMLRGDLLCNGIEIS